MPPIKCDDKYQDLLASIILMLSNTFVYDLSSKYLRKDQINQHLNNNYIIMNSGGS